VLDPAEARALLDRIDVATHEVAVEFDFVRPRRPFRHSVDELGELRPESIAADRPCRQVSGALPVAPCREREGVTARGMRLFTPR
jgi:hypothetical protein